MSRTATTHISSEHSEESHPITAHHSNHKNHSSNKFRTSSKTHQKPKITAHHSTSPQSQFKNQHRNPDHPSIPTNSDSDNFSELVLNSVKKQSCRDFAAKLPSQGQSCSKFHFQPDPKILRKPPLHTPKRRYPLHLPHHTPNPTKKHPGPDLASTAAASGNERQYRGDTTSQKHTPSQTRCKDIRAPRLGRN